MQIDGTRPDRAAARQGYAGVLHTGQQWSQYEDRRTHLAHQVVGRLAAGQAGRTDDHLVGLTLDPDPQALQELDNAGDIAKIRHIGEAAGAVREQRRRQDWQGRIFGTTDGDGPLEPSSAFDNNLVHNFRSAVRCNPMILRYSCAGHQTPTPNII